jgi:hypothetical protein
VQVYNNMLQVLSDEDRQLPALQSMMRMLKRMLALPHTLPAGRCPAQVYTNML